MNQKQQLKVQAYMDGELSSWQRWRIERWIANDPEAGALCAELRQTRSLLAVHEPEGKLPESREFYWSKIRREIERQESAATTRAFELPAWWKASFLRPATAVAVASLVVLGSFLALEKQFSAGSHYLAEFETSGDEMGSITFRSEAERMTVVYLFNRQPEAQESASDIFTQ